MLLLLNSKNVLSVIYFNLLNTKVAEKIKINYKKLAFIIKITFQMLTEESTQITQNWNQVHFISDDELKCQVCMYNYTYEI